MDSEFTDKLIKDFMFLWATIDPVGTLALFASVTVYFTPEHRKSTALKAILYSGAILICSIIFGQLLLSYMGIQLISLQFSGGIILFLFALQMIFKNNTEDKPNKEANHDIAVFPLAIPSIATPGAIMAAIILTDNHVFSISTQICTAIILLVILGITYLFMLLATPIMKLIGNNGATILVKIMGMILAALSTEIVMDALNIPEWVDTFAK